MKAFPFAGLLSLLLVSNWILPAKGFQVEVTVRHRSNEKATSTFEFEDLVSPASTDAGNLAKVTVRSGRADGNSPGLACLTDGVAPDQPDQPARNFFFGGRPGGGQILFDLQKPIEVKEIRTYSWHPNVRGPQVFFLYATNDVAIAKRDIGRRETPESIGWSRIAEVDTREASEELGGQYASKIATKDASPIGSYQFLLFDVQTTSQRFGGGETFFSEIDIDDGNKYERQVPEKRIDTLKIGEQYTIHFDTTEVEDLQPWVKETLMPVCREWYPRIVELLPSDGYEEPKEFTIVFKGDMDGVAYASGTQITAAGPWYRRNLEGEALGSIVHEMVHIVQQYRGGRRRNRNPGWMVEGVADYVRWFLYEPEKNRPRVNPARANYTDSYRTTAAFLNYAVNNYDEELVKKFNAKMREGEYSDSLWKELTGKEAEEIWNEFAESLR